MEERFFLVTAIPGQEALIRFSGGPAPEIRAVPKGIVKTRSAGVFLQAYPALKDFIEAAEKWRDDTSNEEFYSWIREACIKNGFQCQDNKGGGLCINY